MVLVVCLLLTRIPFNVALHMYQNNESWGDVPALHSLL